MGTNYYAQEAPCHRPCTHCQQAEWHIGKSLRMFAAHEVTPWGRIETWANWKRVIRSPGVLVRDEYGRHHEVEDFIAAVDSVEPEWRRRQFDWLVEHSYDLDRDYLDPEGFSFHRGEFS